MINRRKKRSTKPKGKDPTKLRRTNVANSMLGLSVVLYPNEGEYSGVVMNNYVGFKALVHSPFDFAEVGGKGFAVEAQKEVIYDNKAKETLVPERGWKYQILPTKVHPQTSSPKFIPRIQPQLSSGSRYLLQGIQPDSKPRCLA